MIKKNMNFKEKNRYYFLGYAFIPISILFLLFSVFFLFSFRLRTINNADKANKNISKLIFDVYDSYSSEIEKMSKSDTVINFVDTHLNSNLVYEDFYQFNNKQKVKSVFHIISSDGIFLASTAQSDPYIDTYSYKNLLSRIRKNPTDTLTEAYEQIYSHGRNTVYSFGRAILKDSNIIGYIIYQLYEEDLQQLIFVQNAEVTVITDQYDRIIVATNNIVKGLMNKFTPEYIDSKRYVKIKNGEYYLSKNLLQEASINVYTLASIKYNSMIFIYYGVFTVIVSLLLWFLINYLANKIALENSSSIDKLLHSVSELQSGNMNSYVTINSGDEFEVLANQYNIMLDNLNELIRNNKELSNIRRISEIKQLQAQFNPHFIFNILETLRYTIVIDPGQAQDIIMVLSRLLRYSIRNNEENVLLKDDLAYIEDYLKLHKIRFKERLLYSIDVSEEVKSTMIPKLLLQAVIENSIKYGYRDKNCLTINIRGNVIGENLVLEVKDNGGGINEKLLDEIRIVLDKPQNTTEHIGLYNVHRRLVLLYGAQYGLKIKSVYGEGTLVSIIIPYGKDGNYVQGFNC